MGDRGRVPDAPLRRPFVVTALLALAPAVGGCQFDLTAVPDPGQTAAFLFLRLEVDEHRGPLDISAAFRPGVDDRERPRAVHDDSLRVDGLAVAPIEISPEGNRHYRLSDLDGSARPRRFRLPIVEGLGDAAAEVLVEPVRVEVADTLVVSPAGAFELRLTGMEGNTGREGFWTVRVYKGDCAGRSLLSLSGSAAPPPVLVIPGNLIEGDLTNGALQFQGAVRHIVASAEGSYEIRVDRSFGACVPLMVSD